MSRCPPWPIKKGSYGHVAYCEAKCQAKYMVCEAGCEAKRAECEAEEAAKAHPIIATVVIVGAVVTTVVYVAPIAAAPAVVLAP